MKLTKDVTCLVIDTGDTVDFANKLGEHFKKVYYYCNFVESFPTMNRAFIGYGLENIERVENLFDYIEEVDLVVINCLFYDDLQVFLESIGKKVWGNRNAEELENNRVLLKKILKKLDLPVGEYAVCKGIDKLREYLKEHENVYVKIPRYRGITETFKATTYKKTEPELDVIEQLLGGFKNMVDFVVEHELKDKVEIGSDTYCIDGVYPNKIMTGVEVKDCAYIAKMKPYTSVPKEITIVNDKLAPILKKYNAKGFISTEIRVGKDKQPYLIDITIRIPEPPSMLFSVMWKNLGDIIWKGANGICVDPEYDYKYGVQLIIHSDWAVKNWQPVNLTKEARKYVRLKNCMYKDGTYYVIPQEIGLKEIGAVIGLGNTKEEAIKNAIENAKYVNENCIHINTDYLKKADEELEKSAKLGIKLF